MVKEHNYIRKAFEKGYRVDDNGNVISPYCDKFRKCTTNSDGYKKFTFRIKEKSYPVSIYVHRLQAYQIFGEEIFSTGLQVRHLDGNSKNNCKSNISLGSASDNMMDKPSSVRKSASIKAAKTNRSLTKQEKNNLLLDRKNGYTYLQLQEKYNIAKSTISYIVNGITYKTE